MGNVGFKKTKSAFKLFRLKKSDYINSIFSFILKCVQLSFSKFIFFLSISIAKTRSL